MQQNRWSDRRTHQERRRNPDRRSSTEAAVAGYRSPSWPEQRIQFLTRYVFLILGVLFFNTVDDIAPTHGDSFTSLLEQVDQALYHSKSTHTGGGLAHAQSPQLAH